MSQISRHENLSQQKIIIFGVYAATLYNTILAILNAHGVSQSFTTVAASEALILAFATTAIAVGKSGHKDLAPLLLITFGIAVSAYLSIANQKIFLDTARNIAIIGVFYMAGSRISQRQLLICFRVLSVLVLLGLLLELINTPLYVQLFQPASFYSATRGIEEFSLDDSGLFRNALGFESRFSFGFSTHRTASIFIEQVSLANYVGVLCVFTITQFARMARKDRVLHILLIMLILLTNDSRTSTFLAALTLIGYYIYPGFSTRFSWFIMPSAVVLGLIVSHNSDGVTSDDFVGRINTTIRHLEAFSINDLFGLNIETLPGMMDSGYAYIIASSTLLGLLILWLFICQCIDRQDKDGKRCLFSLNTYMFANLMIGGTAVFSMKIAAPLWLLVGFMASEPTATRIHSLLPPNFATANVKQ